MKSLKVSLKENSFVNSYGERLIYLTVAESISEASASQFNKDLTDLLKDIKEYCNKNSVMSFVNRIDKVLNK